MLALSLFLTFSFALSSALVLASPTLVLAVWSTASWFAKIGLELLVLWSLMYR